MRRHPQQQDMPGAIAPPPDEEFSLFLGGPLYQFLRRIGLIKPPLDRMKWRVFALAMLAWGPLLLLALLDRRLLGGVKIPFLYDFEVAARLLAFLPLLVLAEAVITTRLSAVVRQFRESNTVPDALADRFGALLASMTRLRNSITIELALLAFVLLAGGLAWGQVVALQSDTWYATIVAGRRTTTPAGYWYQFVSVPLTQFVVLRWYYRIVLWWRFLWQVSKLELNLVPTHPDRACGLGFLDLMVFSLSPFLLAHSCLLSGYIANRVLYGGATLPAYYVEIGALALFLYVLALGPLCVFTRPLLRARFKGLLTYGRFAGGYVSRFDRKWIGGVRSPEEPLLGTGDIQSLADMANSFAVVQGIFPFPFGLNSVVGLAVIVAIPLLPLALTMFSWQELLARLVNVLL